MLGHSQRHRARPSASRALHIVFFLTLMALSPLVILSDYEAEGTFGPETIIALQIGEIGVIPAVIDPAGQFAHFATYTRPSRTVKARLSDFTRVDAIFLQVQTPQEQRDFCASGRKQT